MNDTIKICSAILLLVCIGMFYIGTIREGNSPGGDFSLYVLHAKNIVEGRTYGDTGFIYNPNYPQLSPKTYPPVFPLILSPVYQRLGLHLTAMKIVCILFFLASLWVAFLMVKPHLGFGYRIAMILIVALNPFFWTFKDDVASDWPFLFFASLTLLLTPRIYRSLQSKKKQVAFGLLVGILLYLAYGTRSIGIILLPCILVYDIIRNRKPTVFVIVATFVYFAFLGLQNILFHGDASYLDQFSRNPKYLINNLGIYVHAFLLLWENGFPNLKVLSGTLFVLILGFAIVGYGWRMKRMTILEIFVPFYLVVVVLWPTPQGARFLIPVIPLVMFYSFLGIEYLSRFLKSNRRFVMKRILLAVFGLLLTFTYLSKYSRMNFSRISGGSDDIAIQSLFDYIKENTGMDDVFIYRFPRILALYTERKASCYHIPHEAEELWNYLHQIKATYLIWTQDDPTFLTLFVDTYRDRFDLVYSHADIKLYRIVDSPGMVNKPKDDVIL